jgi:TRAP-type transport system periplasmic protein
LGATPVAMTLGDVLPALQQGAIDGAIAGMTVFSAFHYQDAAKYVTELNQPSIFLMIEVSKTWYDSLPPDLQTIIDKVAAAETVAINPAAVDLFYKARENWTANGGELISFSPAEQSKLIETISSVGEDVSRKKPSLHDAYNIVAEAARRTAQGPSQ